MKSRFVFALTGLVLSMPVAPILAQRVSSSSAGAPTATVFDVTPYAGYMVFGSFLDGPLGTNIGTANGPLYGVQAALTVAPNVAIVGNVGYASSDLKIGVPIIGGFDVGSSNVLLYDGSLQLSMPMAPGSPIKPFVQGGAGAIRYDIKSGPLTVNSTNLAWNLGGGVDYQVTPSIGVRAMVKDYIGKFDFKDATQLDFQGKTAHNIGITAGLKLAF